MTFFSGGLFSSAHRSFPLRPCKGMTVLGSTFNGLKSQAEVKQEDMLYQHQSIGREIKER